MSKKYTVGDGTHEPMEGYVDQIGQIKPKDVKQVKSAAGNVLKEINQHTKNISELEKERRAVRVRLHYMAKPCDISHMTV